MDRDHKTAKNAALVLAGIIAIFLVVSGFLLWRYYFIYPDSNYLLALGKNIVTGKGLTISGGAHFRYPPAYGTFAGLIYLLIGNLEAAAHIASMLSGIGTIIVVYLLTTRVYNRDTGLLAALLVAVNPLFGRIGSAALGEAFYALGYSIFILLVFLQLEKPNPWLSLLTGLVASIVYLTRAEGFLLLPLGFIILLISWWRAKWPFVKIALSLVLLVVGWMLLGFPYLLFLREHLGGWALSGKITQNIERVSEAVYIGDFESLRDTSLKAHESPGLLPYLIQNFPRVAERYVYFTWYAVKLAIVRTWPVLLLYGWFIWLAMKDRTRRAWHFIAMASILPVYPLAHIEIRYVTPYFMAFAPVIAWGMYRAWAELRQDDKKVTLRRYLVAITFAGMMLGCVYEIIRTKPPPYEHRILADWMVENLDDARTSRLSSRFAYVNFYLNNEDFRYLPKADTLAETIDLARERKITYIVYSDRLTADVRPALEPLLNTENVPDGLELVVRLDPPDVPDTIILYRVVND